jgi:hypothetical protein
MDSNGTWFFKGKLIDDFGFSFRIWKFIYGRLGFFKLDMDNRSINFHIKNSPHNLLPQEWNFLLLKLMNLLAGS